MLRKSRTNFCILTVIPFFDFKAFSADKIVEQGRGGGGWSGGRIVQERFISRVSKQATVDNIPVGVR